MTDRPAWILLPGFSQTPSIWAPIAAQLAAARLPAIPGGLDLATTVDTLAELGGRGRWAGYSMGGRLALRVALDHPDRVEHLVLISATAGIRNAQERAQRRAAEEEQAAHIEREGVDRFLDGWIGNPLFTGVDPVALRAHRLRSAAAIADQLRHLGQGAQPPLWERLGDISCPVTVVAGGRDSHYSAIAGELAAAIPGAELEIIPGAGHALLVEQPDRIATLLSGRT